MRNSGAYLGTPVGGDPGCTVWLSQFATEILQKSRKTVTFAPSVALFNRKRKTEHISSYLIVPCLLVGAILCSVYLLQRMAF
jgi:hypothetical protein